MGVMAEKTAAASLKALITRDRRLAHAVILSDDRIDDLEKQIDRLCLEFLVRQQPVAGHLRFLYSCIKINTELERIGDYAESVARYALDLSVEQPHPSVELLAPIGELATGMLHGAMAAFTARSPEQARATLAIERQVDALRGELRLKLIEQHRSGELATELLIPLIVVTGRFERLADQSANICEEVLYMCTGEMEKHKGKEAARVLFLYRECSRLGLMAEAVAQALGQSDFLFSSAGASPDEPDLRTVDFLATKGIDMSRWVPRSLGQIPNLDHYQVAVLLGDGTEEAASGLPPKCIRFAWRTPPLASPEAPAAEAQAANEQLFTFLDESTRGLIDAFRGDLF